MPLIDYPDLTEVDEQTAELLDRSRSDSGDLPSFPHMLANNPSVLGAALGQFGEIMYGGGLPPNEKQLAFVVVSQANECAYCAASHGQELVNAFGLPVTQLEAIAAGDYTELTDRQRAIVEFARQGAVDPKRVTDGDVVALREVGFNDADVMELVAVLAQATFANTIVDVLNVLPSDQSPELARYYPKADTDGSFGVADVE